MSAEIIDSFAHYVIGDVLTKGYASIRTPDAIVTGRLGVNSKALRFATGSNLVYHMAADQTTVITGHGFQMTGSLPTECEVVTFQDSGVGDQVRITLNSSGLFKAYRGSTLLGTSTYALALNNWIHFAVKVLVSATVGTVEVRVNNVVLTGLNLSGINTKNTANTRINQITWGYNFGTSGFIGSAYYSDLFLFNGAGSTCNDFPGDVGAYLSAVDGNGDTQNFTRSSGSSDAAMVNQATQDGDTTYLSDGTVGDIELLTTADLSSISNIQCVQVVNTVRKDDAGSRHVSAILKSAGTVYVGPTDVSLGNSYLMAREIWETDPATSAAWTLTNVNAAQAGLKVTA